MRFLRNSMATLLAFLLVCTAFSQENTVFAATGDSITRGDNIIKGDIDGIISRGVLKVAITAVDQPPFYFVGKDGRLTGYDIDLAAKMAEELGVRLEISREAPAFNDL